MSDRMPRDGEERALSYFDVRLLAADVELLRGPEWLNDQIIGFFFEYLAREAFAQVPGLLLVPACATYVLAMGSGGGDVILEPLGFAAASMALFAVSDNPDRMHAYGGSHWSLLAYCAADNTFRHYDSMAGANRQAAAAVFKAAAVPGSRLVHADTPQQHNGYDCGLYVLWLARLLCQRYAAAAAGAAAGAATRKQAAAAMSFEVAAAEVTPADVAALRQELLDLVSSKAAAAAAAGGT